MTGGLFAPVGFDFTLSALFFHYRDWRATFLLVSSVNEARSMPAKLHFVSAAVSNLLGTTHEAQPAIAPALRIVSPSREECAASVRSADYLTWEMTNSYGLTVYLRFYDRVTALLGCYSRDWASTFLV
jgi:hypothetical protein